MNERLKIFNVLKACLRHTEGRDRDNMICKHGMCLFTAVAETTQSKLEEEGGVYHTD